MSQARATKPKHQDEQYKYIWSRSLEDDEFHTPIIGSNFDAPALYVIKQSPGKGLGMFATRMIPKGTRILAEKPVFSFAKQPELSVSDPYGPNDISQAFDRLSSLEKLRYKSLHCPQRSHCSNLVSIYEANCYEMGLGSGICFDAARINHSCIPNAHYSWNDRIERENVHAVKDIIKDEEITISYCSAMRTLKERKLELKPYVFACSCAACQIDNEFGVKSQIRRLEMRDLYQQISDYEHDPADTEEDCNPCNEWSAILTLINLLDEEGLVYEKSRVYRAAADCALEQDRIGEALDYLSRELQVDLCCVGADSPIYKETKSFFLELYSGIGEL